MATLGGIFDSKPRSKRNFLLENKRDVKEKSSSNSQKHKVTADLSQKHMILQAKPHSEAIKDGSSSAAKLRGPFYSSRHKPESNYLSKHQSVKSGVSTLLPNRFSSGTVRTHSKKSVGSTRSGHYIDQENVPFEWTEVCPSLISHKICHQGVQTEENDSSHLTRTYGDKGEKQNEAEKNYHAIIVEPKVQNIVSNGGSHDEDNFSKEQIGSNEINRSREDEKQMSKLISGVESFHCTNHKGRQERQKESSETANQTISTSRKMISSNKMPGDLELYPPSYQKGVIPKYLSRRKAEQAIASARAKEIDLNCPEGHVAMPDCERRDTLDMILKNYNDFINKLNKIPVRTDTLKMKQKKIEIEKQLDKLEEGIRIFSRSKVYVKLDA